MLDRGWVVVATDYAGLGTEGVESYLVAQSEVRDVVNAVRAARDVPESNASSTYAIFGHSQGGHASLWAGTLAPAYAPELQLVGVAGAAPAAPLAGLVDVLWDSDLAWLIGAEVAVSYPANDPELDPADVLTADGLGAYAELAEKCLDSGGLESEIRQRFEGDFFATNPLDHPEWGPALRAQSAPPVPGMIPVLVTQSVNDGVIAAEVIARMTNEWCAAGSTIETVWLGPLRGSMDKPSVLTHIYEGAVGGATTTTWLEGRFAGEPAPTSCGQRAPIVAPSDGEPASTTTTSSG
jgi:acetyl esterase/lipase